jgi:D-threo-aldose 1-dehydrogenase
MTGLERRPLGQTSLDVTVLGLGCATLGGHRVPVTRQTAESVVRAAWTAGLRYFDTAPFYGLGQSERCLGDALREVPRDEWVLSTKVGRLLSPRTGQPTIARRQHPMPFELVYDYTYDGVMRAFEDSVQRLGLARIDILFVHDIGARQHKDAHSEIIRTFRNGGYQALRELRRSGAVHAIGIGAQEQEVLLEAMEWGEWDVFLLAGRYTLLEQEGLDDLFPKCLESGISIVIGAPHNTGILAGYDSWNYRPAPPEIVGRAKAIRAICDRHEVPMIAAALQFPLAHPAVAAVLPGPRNVEELEIDTKLVRHPIPKILWADLRDGKLLRGDAPTPS